MEKREKYYHIYIKDSGITVKQMEILVSTLGLRWISIQKCIKNQKPFPARYPDCHIEKIEKILKKHGIEYSLRELPNVI